MCKDGESETERARQRERDREREGERARQRQRDRETWREGGRALSVFVSQLQLSRNGTLTMPSVAVIVVQT